MRPEVFLEKGPNGPWRPRLPGHMKGSVPAGPRFFRLKETLRAGELPTVCEAALCPNRTDCWARGTLAFQILGDICTRRCAFCAETTGRPGVVDPEEAERLVAAVSRLQLTHVVITSPARDDLPDQGAGAFAACVAALRRSLPSVTVEVLVPDFQGRPDLLEIVFASRPDIFNHNLETVRRLTPMVRARATYENSLSVLSRATSAGMSVKSGLMVGLGEERGELTAAFRDLRDVGVRSLTVGQYLPPSPRHYPVARFYGLDEFADLRREASEMFAKAMIGPRVRSSYHADETVIP